MKITEIYQNYHINKGLQEHMVRVAAVGKLVCDHTTVDVDEDLVVSACLLHDLGNLAKVKFIIPGFEKHFEPEGVEYWKNKQREIFETISTDEYEVANHYLKDIGVSSELVDAVNQIGLSKLKETVTEKPIEDQILIYADLRVGPHGILSTKERMDDIAERYVPEKYTLAFVDECRTLLDSIEAKLFAGADIAPSDISDESTAAIQEELLGWEIETGL